MVITAQAVKELRDRSGAGMMDCKKALQDADGDIEKALQLLRERGISKAAKKEGRATKEGLVGSYVHATGKIGVLVEVACETDFVARTDEFQALVKDICMHVAASSPVAVTREEIPESVAAAERELMNAQVAEWASPRRCGTRSSRGRWRSGTVRRSCWSRPS